MSVVQDESTAISDSKPDEEKAAKKVTPRLSGEESPHSSHVQEVDKTVSALKISPKGLAGSQRSPKQSPKVSRWVPKVSQYSPKDSEHESPKESKKQKSPQTKDKERISKAEPEEKDTHVSVSAELESTESIEKTGEDERKEAVNVMNTALEKITISQILEYRQCTQPPPVIEKLVLALMSLITQIDDTVESPVRNWTEAKVIFTKPGHFVNSLRRFPYAVDSGRVTYKNRKGLIPDMFSEEQLEKASLLAVNLNKWFAAALAYYDASPKIHVPESPPGSGAKSPPSEERKSRVTPTRFSSNKFGVPPVTPTMASPIVAEKKFEKMESKIKPPALKKKAVSSTESSPKMTTRTVKTPGGDTMDGGISKLNPRVPSRNGLRQSLNTDRLRKAETNSGNVVHERKPLIEALVETKSQESVPQSNSRPVSAKSTPKYPTVKTIPMSPSVASGRKDLSASLSSNPKVINMRMDEHQSLVEQTKREVRELRSLEAKSRWDMVREEKRYVEEREAEIENDLMRWRWKEGDDMKQLMQQVNEQVKLKELYQSRETQFEKREIRRASKEEEIKRIEDMYLEHKKDARWDAELKKSISHERTELVVNNIDQYNHIRETSKALDMQYKQEQRESRMLEQQSDANLLQKKLLAEKEALLQNLKFVHDRLGAPINQRG